MIKTPLAFANGDDRLEKLQPATGVVGCFGSERNGSCQVSVMAGVSAEKAET